MTISDIAVRISQIVPRERIKDHSVPLHLLYLDLIKSKDILPLSQLSRGEKLKYWKETEGERFSRVIQASAVYVYDLVTQK